MAAEQIPDNEQDIHKSDIASTVETQRLHDIANETPNAIQAEGDTTQNATTQNQSESVRYISEKTKWERADKIAVWSVIVNVIMAIITLSAVLIALDASKSGDKNFTAALTEGKKAADASVKAANAAENTLNVTKDAFKYSNENFLKSLEQYKKVAEAAKRSTDISEKQFELTKSYSKKNDSNYLKSINIATNTLITSQQSLIAAQNNFTVQNRAYIMLNNVLVDSIKPFIPEIGNISLRNFGKTPALLLNSVINFSIDTTIFNIKRIYTEENIKYINIYIPENGEFSIPFKCPGMENDLYQKVINNKVFFIIYGEVLFRDMVTSKLYTYVFSFRILNNKRFAPTPNNNLVYEISSVDKWLTKNK